MKLEEFVMREDFRKYLYKMESSDRFGDAQYKLIDKETRLALKKVNAILKEPKRKKLIMGAVNNFRHAGRAVNGRIYNHCNLNKQLLASKLQLSAEKVNNLLECKVSMPELRRENPALFAYTPSLNVISYPRRYSIYEVEQELMHEYCHAMQFSAPYPFSWLKNKLLGEGFAEAVSRHLMVKSSPFQREAARIMLKHSVNNLLREDDLDIYLYDFGFAAFFLVQQKHGAGIYKEIIRTEKPFEYLLDHL